MRPDRTIFLDNEPKRWNPKQTKVLLAGLAAVALSLLFPPWLYFNNNTSGQESAGYHFFRNPPTITDPEKIFDLSYENLWGEPEEEVRRRRSFSVKLNGIRLFVQVSFLLSLTFGLIRRWSDHYHIAQSWCAHTAPAVAGWLFAALILLMVMKF